MNKQKTWNEIKSELFRHEKISNELYWDYLANASIVKLTADNCVIGVNNTFAQEIFRWIKPLIEDIFCQKIKVSVKVTFVVIPQISLKQASLPLKPTPKKYEHTFANYILGVANQDVYQAVHETLAHPGARYNPLFISGYPGVGKTHLLKAAHHYLTHQNENITTRYLPSEEFCHQVVAALQESNQTIETYKNTLKQVDVILIDDIQFLKNKRKTNEIFFHLVDYWVEHHKQILISSDKKITALKGFAERLISRFANGLSLTLGRPDLTTMVQILKYNLLNNGQQPQKNPITLSDDILLSLAKNAHGDIRALKGHLNKVLFKIIIDKLDPAQLTTEQLALFLDTESCEWNKEIVLKLIKTKVAGHYNLTVHQLHSASRSKQIVQARNLTFYLINRLMNYSFLSIAQLFNRKDHSIVVRGCKKIAHQLEEDKPLQHQVLAWENEIKANMA